MLAILWNVLLPQQPHTLKCPVVRSSWASATSRVRGVMKMPGKPEHCPSAPEVLGPEWSPGGTVHKEGRTGRLRSRCEKQQGWRGRPCWSWRATAASKKIISPFYSTVPASHRSRDGFTVGRWHTGWHAEELEAGLKDSEAGCPMRQLCEDQLSAA